MKGMGMWPFKTKAVEIPVVEKSIPEREFIYDGSVSSVQTTIWTNWSTELAIQDAFKMSPTVYAGVSKYMMFCGMIPWHAEKMVDGSWVRDDECKLAQILESPHPVPSLSWSYMMQIAAAYILLGGNAYFAKINPKRGKFGRLVPLPPDRVRVIRDATEIIGGYEYNNGSELIKYKVEDIIHIMLPDPANIGYGIGRVQAAGKLIDADLSSLEWQKSQMDNGCVPSFVMALDGSPNDTAQLQSIKNFRAQFVGQSKARSPMLVWGLKGVHVISNNAVEMDFVNSRNSLKQEILSALDVNQEMVKWTANSKFDNFDRAVMDFLVNSVTPLMSLIRNSINDQIKGDDGYPGYRVNFQITEIEPFRAVSSERVKQVKELQQTGMPVNIASGYLGLDLPRFEGDDVSYVTQNMFRADSPQDDSERGVIGRSL